MASLVNSSAAGSKQSKTSVNDALQQRVAAIRQRKIDFIANSRFSGAPRFQECVLEKVRLVEQGLLYEPEMRLSAGLPAHLSRMCATPLLTPEEESCMFERMNYCKFRATKIQQKLRPMRPKSATICEFDDMIERGERLRNYLLQANTRLVVSIAKKFADARNTFDDLLSQGITSLLHATEKFDFERGYRFSTYATCAVRRELYRTVMNQKKQFRRFATGATELLDGHVATEESNTAPEVQIAEYENLSSRIGRMLQNLDEREQVILFDRFGFGESRKSTSYSKLGAKLGISKERVRQLANRALDKLRTLVPEYALEQFVD